MVIVACARAAEKFIDYPDSIARLPALRWAATVVVSIALIAAIILGPQLAAVAWQVAVIGLLAFGALYLILLGAVRVLERLGV